MGSTWLWLMLTLGFWAIAGPAMGRMSDWLDYLEKQGRSEPRSPWNSTWIWVRRPLFRADPDPQADALRRRALPWVVAMDLAASVIVAAVLVFSAF